MARAALRAGLIDRIGDRTQFGERMAALAGNDDDARPRPLQCGPLRGLGRRASGQAMRAARSASSPSPATIVDGEAGPGTAGGETIARNLERGLESGNLRALVVRVDSPGGSVLASERIRRAVLAAKARGLPIVISMGSVAASGGYWVATAGDVIFAEPSTITGSIGVFGILPSFEGTLQRLGIGADGVRTTPLSGEPDLLRGPAPEAERLLQTGVESTYRRFIALVARGAAAVAGASPRDRPGAGVERRHGAAIGPGRSLRLARRRRRRCGAAGGARSRPRSRRAYLEQEPGFLARLFGGRGGDNAAGAPRDAFARLARRPEAMIERALHEAQAPARRAGDPGALPRMPGDRAGAAARRSRAMCWSRLAALVAARMKIRAATADDAAAIASIYAPYVAGKHRLVRD